MKNYILIISLVTISIISCQKESETVLKKQTPVKKSSVGKIEINRGPFGSIFLEIMTYENFRNPKSINYLKKETGC